MRRFSRGQSIGSTVNTAATSPTPIIRVPSDGATILPAALDPAGISGIPNFIGPILSFTALTLCLFSGTPTARAQCIAPPSGLVAWLPADGNLANLGSGVTSTFATGAVTFGSGVVGQAFSFSGSAALVTVGASADLNLQTAVTIAAWVKPANFATAGVIAGRPSGYQLDVLTNGHVRFAFPSGANGNVNKFLDSVSSLPTTSFSFVTATYDSSAGLINVYVNGVLESSTQTSGLIDSMTAPFQIGGFSNPAGSYYTGLIDEVQLFNRAVTASEIQTVYNAGSAGICKAGLQSQPIVTEFQVPAAGPQRITAGPDGNLWFTQSGADRVGTVTTAGVITQFPAKAAIGITTGPDGDLWFVEAAQPMIGRITTNGVFTDFPSPRNAAGLEITAGPDGNLWFTTELQNIGRMSTAGVFNGEFPVVLDSINSAPQSITVGPDSNLWFTMGTFGRIDRMTPTGAVTAFQIPNDSIPQPTGITTGPDGNLWFLDANANVWKTTTGGVMNHFSMPQNVGSNGQITLGPDGNLWFSGGDFYGPGLLRMTPGGQFTMFHLEASSSPLGLTAGPDGNVWFADNGTSRIGKIALSGPRITNISSTNPDGVYGPGSIIAITITFDSPVTVTGTPQLPLNSGGIATYTSGSGANTLTFTYTVGTGQSAQRLDATGLMALAKTLNGATIKDSSGDFALLTLPVAPAGGALGVTKSITISQTVPITINSTVSALSFTVTGTGCQPGSYSTPTTLNWATSASCTVQFSTPQSGGSGAQYVFTGWTDGGITANPRTITTPAASTTYTANITTQYQLTTAASPAGAGAASGAGYYDSGSSAPIAATPNANYQFTNWTGPAASASSSSTTVTMSGPLSVTANFQLITTTAVAAVTGQYGDTVTLGATVGPPGAVFTGTLQFQVGGVSVGSPVAVNGAGTYTTIYTIDNVAGSYPIAATLSSASPAVAGSSGTNTLTVNRATSAIAWPAPAAISYGTALSSTQLNATATGAGANVAGTFVYSPAAGTALSAGNNQTLSVTFTPTETAKYTTATATTTITVNKANASVTPAAASKTYGAADPPLAGTLSGFLAADGITATYSRIAGETVGGSPYTISATLAPAGALGNYNITYNTGNFAITKAPALVTPDPVAKTYGAADPPLTGTLSGFLAADNVTALYNRPPGETVTGSPYLISATLSPAGVLGNYNITYNTANFTINKATASVTPNAASKSYGAADPPFTGTLAGFLAADGITASYSRTPGEAVAASPYAISATLSPAGALANYNITYSTGNFTIAKAAASVTPNASSKTYGAADPVLTGTLSGFLAADNVTAAYTRTAGEAVTGSPYPISATLSPAGALGNYNITYNTANFTINKATASVTPNAASKSYGAADPTFIGTLAGFLAADGITASYSRTPGEAIAGSPYAISATLSPAGALANYNITYNTGNFTITKAAASVTPNASSKTYGATDPVLSGTLSGFLAADNVTAAYTRAAGEAVGGSPYPISTTLSPAGVLGNYNVTYNTANFTINKATASVTPNAASKSYGAPDPPFTGTLAGFLAADGITASYSRTPGEAVAASPYAISATLGPAGALANYNITYSTGNFTISKAAASVTPNTSSKTYGAADPV